jgi:glycerol kinase
MKNYVLAVDAGGTRTRAVLMDRKGRITARAFASTKTLSPEEGAIEHDPEELYQAVRRVILQLLHEQEIRAGQVTALGISVQRGTFCLWDRRSGKPRSNFISWSDVRSAGQTVKMNRNLLWKIVQTGAGIASRVTGSTFLIAASQLKFVTDHAITRLLWIFDKNPGLRGEAERGNLLFGTIDTWLLYRLTGRTVHATDASNAASTSLYNPFDLKWNGLFCKLFKIPRGILPEVRDSSGDFGTTDPRELGGFAIPIRAVVGDQMSALFGHCCFMPGEVKISQGSGSFVDVNVGARGRGSRRGLFPMIAWQMKGIPTYMLEGSVATAGRLIDWLGHGLGLSDTPKALNEFASRAEDSNGVVFVPTPAGIRFPYFNPKAKGTIFGLSLTTHRGHVARAVLEGIAHRIVDILEGIRKDTGQEILRVKVDGGVSQSDILLQMIADLSGYEVERAPEVDMTAVGAAYLAGLASGFWKKMEDLLDLGATYQRFSPSIGPLERRVREKRWRRAVRGVVKMYR